MIKNLFIVVLTLLVGALSWMVFLDGHGRDDNLVSQLRSSVRGLKDFSGLFGPSAEEAPVGIDDGKDGDIKETGVEQDPKGVKETEKQKDDEEQDVILIAEEVPAGTAVVPARDDDSSDPVPVHTAGPEEILMHISRKPGNDEFTDEELDAVLSLLRSARETLRGASFPLRSHREVKDAGNDQPEQEGTKKKLFDGPGKSG